MSDPRRTPLLTGISQFEVDFVIPRVGVDLRLGIDPFLLFKSRDDNLREQHAIIIGLFQAGIDAINRDDDAEAYRLFDFPEPPEVGFGYTAKSRRGTGVGHVKAGLLVETIRASEALRSRGLRHIEELQLLSVRIGADGVSDIAANILKRFLIDYTQRQAATWNLPVQRGVPVGHFFDATSYSWESGYFDLPVSSADGEAILLVPRRIVRTLPWINYDDFVKSEFAAYLRAKKASGRHRGAKEKPEIVRIARSEFERVERYVRRKEEDAASAQPSQSYLDNGEICPEADRLAAKLAQVPAGTSGAADYQRTVLEILNYLFNPELIDGELEVRTVDGTERRDIVFTNDSDGSFWQYLRQEHSSIFLMFETKNKTMLETADLNQTATYLGDRLGRLGFIATREPISDAGQRKLFSIYNDSNPRKVILVLADADFKTMLHMKCRGQDPMTHLRQLYRKFRMDVQ